MSQNSKSHTDFQNGDSADQGNYRPVSFLPVFSKVIKKLLIIEFSTIALLFPKQIGFRVNHATHHAILNLVNDIKKFFEKG